MQDGIMSIILIEDDTKHNLEEMNSEYFARITDGLGQIVRKYCFARTLVPHNTDIMACS